MKRFCVPVVLLGALLMTTGCPDGTPGKETVRNGWEDMLDELKAMDEESMKKNWKRYYKRAIADLQNKVKELKSKQVDLNVKLKLEEKHLAEKEPKAKRAKQLLKSAITKYKTEKAAGKTTFSISNDPTQELSAADAKKQIQKWSKEFKRNYADAKVAKRRTLAKKLKTSVGKIQIAIDTYNEKIEQLEEQMVTYEADLELAKVQDSLNALCATGTELAGHSGDPSLEQLAQLNKSLDKAIAKSEVETEMIEDEKKLKQKFSSLEDEVSSVGADLDVDADLAKELEEIQ